MLPWSKIFDVGVENQKEGGGVEIWWGDEFSFLSGWMCKKNRDARRNVFLIRAPNSLNGRAGWVAHLNGRTRQCRTRLNLLQ